LSISPLYELARAARGLGGRPRTGKRWPHFLYFTDPQRTPNPELIIATLPRGCGVVYRAFGARSAVRKGRDLIRIARRRGLTFFVGADSRLAAQLGADGVHLPERTAGRRGHNLSLKSRFWLSAAAHDEPAVRRARAAGIEAVVISPVFPSASPSAGRAMGVFTFARLARLTVLPAYALGGVNQRTIRRLKGAGAVGVAAVSGAARVDPSKT
jgi:thiamine-phosphate pyrophosphorylase